MLSVESSRATKCRARPITDRRRRPRLSPVGGVGINYAVQDAVEVANMLTESIRRGRVDVSELEAFQHLREPVVRKIQRLQGYLQDRIAGRALQAGGEFKPPWILNLISHIPILRDMPARMIAFGPKHVRLKE